jgi:diketogulonate reductase-like aldo/keto reductase
MKDRSVSRRQFLKNSTLGLVGAGIAGRLAAETLGADKEKKQTAGPAKVKTFRKLGRTGFMTTDLGSGRPTSAAVLNALLDAGVNYIDTGESYSNGKSETWTGQALKNRDRKSYFITSKLKLKKGETKESILRRTRKCLERLDTAYR